MTNDKETIVTYNCPDCNFSVSGTMKNIAEGNVTEHECAHDLINDDTEHD